MKTVVFDFDGVIHPYTSGWQGIDKTPDPPVPEAVETIRRLRRRGYKVIVVSARSSVSAGLAAIKRYLKKWNIEVDGVTAEKPPAVVYVDDRSICFVPGMNLYYAITHFKTWYENGVDLDESEVIDDGEHPGADCDAGGFL